MTFYRVIAGAYITTKALSDWTVSLPEALAWIDKLRPKRAILTNLHGDLDFARLTGELPANVEPAFDGMRIYA